MNTRTIAVLVAALINTTASVHAADLAPCSAETYVRAEWGYWTDKDADGFDTRHAVLRDRSDQAAPLIDKSGRSSRVRGGGWVDAWTGAVIIGSASEMDIDHAVSLLEAHISGGCRWDSAKKKAFANDRRNLLVMTAASNRSKGGADVASPRGRPKDRALWRPFAHLVERVKEVYDLEIDPAEAAALHQMRGPRPPG